MDRSRSWFAVRSNLSSLRIEITRRSVSNHCTISLQDETPEAAKCKKADYTAMRLAFHCR
jgi:hypothetical protein